MEGMEGMTIDLLVYGSRLSDAPRAYAFRRELCELGYGRHMAIKYRSAEV